MATLKFKSEVSPYVGIDERKNHESDYKYSGYTDLIKTLNRRSPLSPPKKSLVCESASGSLSIKPNPAATVRTLNTALFGLGRAGVIHLRNILANPDVKLVYIVEMDERLWGTSDEKWNLAARGVTFLRPQDAGTVFKDENIHCCVIATTTHTHEQYVKDALNAGKAVFCEKPIAESREQTLECYKLAERANRPLFCAFNRRFDPSFRNVYDRVHAGELGHVQVVKTVSRDSPLPTQKYLKTSGGIFHDCAVHDIDIITWIVGELPIRVFTLANALMSEIKDMDDFDTLSITMEFASGTIGVIDISRYACYGYDQRLEAFGEKGMLESKNVLPNSVMHYTPQGSSGVPIEYSFPSRYSAGYEFELAHFLEVVHGNVASSVTGKMTSAVSKIVSAAEQSARSRQPVDITWQRSEIPEEYLNEGKRTNKRMTSITEDE